MLSDIMTHYRLVKDFRDVGYFETEDQKKIIKELKAAVMQGRLIVLSGIVGSGKTSMLKKFRELLEKEKGILISESLSAEADCIKLRTLIVALFYDLSSNKKIKIPVQSEQRERKLRDLIRNHQKTVVLLIDDAHKLHTKTLKGLKRLMEVIRDGGCRFSIILAGHPKLKNDLRRPVMEEIGARAAFLSLDGIKSTRKQYIEWVIDQSTESKVKNTDVFTEDAIEFLSQKLLTPLQIEFYLAEAVKEGHKIGEKPITSTLIENIIARDIEGLESMLTRHGYNVKSLSDILNVRPAEVKSFLHGQLTPNRSQELKTQMLAVGVPI